MQYFYIVVYTIVGDDLTMCKVAKEGFDWDADMDIDICR